MEALLESAKVVGVPAAMLLVALVAGVRGDWVFGWVHREAMARIERETEQEITRLRDDNRQLREELLTWQLLTLESQGIGERALDLAHAPPPPTSAPPSARTALSAALRARKGGAA